MPEFTGRLRTPRLATAPATPTAGEMYFDTTTNSAMTYNGSVWVPTGPAPAISCGIAATQSVASGTFTAVTWPALADNTFTSPNQYAVAFTGGGTRWHESAGSSFTFPKAGYYQVTVRLIFANNNAGYRRFYCQLGTAEYVLGDSRSAVNDTNVPTSLTDTTIIRVPAGATISVMCVQTTGSPLNIIISDGGIGIRTYFAAQWIASL